MPITILTLRRAITRIEPTNTAKKRRNVMMYRFFRRTDSLRETCFNVATCAPLLEGELAILTWLLAETFEPELFGDKPFVTGEGVSEVGPRLSFATPFSTNAVAMCHACGLTKVTRVERSRR